MIVCNDGVFRNGNLCLTPSQSPLIEVGAQQSDSDFPQPRLLSHHLFIYVILTAPFIPPSPAVV